MTSEFDKQKDVENEGQRAVRADENPCRKYIQMPAPTWHAVLPLMLEGYVNGTDTGRQIAFEELNRMAKIADMMVARGPDIPPSFDVAVNGYPSSHMVAGRSLAEWTAFARQDDCLDQMLPSDLREILNLIVIKPEGE